MHTSTFQRSLKSVLATLLVAASIAPTVGTTASHAAPGDWGVVALDPVTVGASALMPIDRGSQTPDISADGRWVAFGSFASVLVEGDSNGQQDVFVHDRQTGTTRRASVKSDGTGVDAAAAYPTVSDDGQRVTFDTNGRFTSADSNSEYDCYVHDFASSETTLVSQTPGGVAGNAYSGSAKISANGDAVAFSSWANNLVAGDTNSTSDVFVRDLVAGQSVRASLADGGAEANDYSWSPSISGDGTRVAFASAATNLVAGDANGFDDIFVRDLIGATTVRASVAHDGSEPNAACGPALISDDGRYVVFESEATNLVAGGTDGRRHIFLRDLQENTTELVSQSTGGDAANGDSQDSFVSAGGSHVVFVSAASNLVPGDTNGDWDVFIRDRNSGTTTRVSVASGGGQADSSCYSGVVSADGGTVAFHSEATNLGAQSDGWTAHVYVRDIGEDATESIISSGLYTTMGNGYSSGSSIAADGATVAYYSSATNLAPGGADAYADVFVTDLDGGGTLLASKGAGGVSANGDSWNPAISADGAAVAFQSYADNLVGGDANAVGDVFVADASTGIAERASVSSAGIEGNGESGTPHLSADGRRVAFLSDATNLVAGDTNNSQDVFVRDRDAQTTVRASVSTGGDQPDQSVWQPHISGNGRYVAFSTDASNLVADDTNDAEDVFVHDLQTGQTVRGSLSATGVELDDGAGSGSLSYDGRLLAFHSRATNVINGGMPSGPRQVYVRDLTSGETTIASAASDGTPGNSSSWYPKISADGRYVTFMSTANNLHPDDTDSNYDVFVHDLQTGETVLASIAPGGPKGNAAGMSPSISGDGSRVAFETAAGNLHAEDNNNTTDIYVARLGSLVPVDSRAPVTTAYGVPDGWVNTDVVVTLEAEDTAAPDEFASGVAGIRYRVGASAVATYTEPIVLASEGVRDIEFAAVDNAGNVEETRTVTVSIDKTPPVNADDARVLYYGPATIMLSPTDALSGVAGATWTLNGGPETDGFTVLAGGYGQHRVVYRATDNAGNESGPRTLDLRVLTSGRTDVEGANRFTTAVEASERAFPGGADTVVLATGWNWPDALGGSALAGAVGAPLLLVNKDTVPESVRAEIVRLGAKDAYILGGEAAVSAQVESALEDLLGEGSVTRLSGDDRYLTARAVADEAIDVLGPAYQGDAFVATGSNFPDALGASPVASAMGQPILLAKRSGMPDLPPAVERVVVLGGVGAVSEEVETALESALGGANVLRVDGDDRYATAAAIADYAVSQGLDWDGVGLATGTGFPDALAGGAMLGSLRSVLLLTRSTSLSAPARERLEDNASEITTWHYIGGTSVLTDSLRLEVDAILER